MNKAEACTAFADVCRQKMPRSRVQYLDIGDYLAVSTHVLLKFAPKRQQQEITSAIGTMVSKLPNADVNVIGLHATHFCAGLPIFPCQVKAVASIRATVFITLLDDVYACRKRLEQAGYPFAYNQLLSWRQIECGIGDNLAAALGTENIYIAGKHPRITLFRLLFEPQCPRLYSASQITKVRDDTDLKNEINAHRERIHQEFVVFDPLTVDDRLLINGLPPSEDDGLTFAVDATERWSCELTHLGKEYAPLIPEGDGFFPLTIDVGEARALSTPVKGSGFRNPIDAQITHRDFRYIDQADVIAAYRPRLGGYESPGVAAEKTYAAGIGATPVVEYSTEQDVSDSVSKPFSTELPGPMLTDLEAFYIALRKTAQAEARRRCKERGSFYKQFETCRTRFAG